MPDISDQEIRERCGSLLNAAADEAARLHHDFIGTEHLFIALTQVEGGIAHRLLAKAGIDPRIARNEIRREAAAYDPADPPQFRAPVLTPRAHYVLSVAVRLADEYGDDVSETHLMMALLTEAGLEGVPMRKLATMSVDLDDWRDEVGTALDVLGEDGHIEDEMNESPRHTALFSGARSTPFAFESEPRERFAPGTHTTPLLDKYGRDLTTLARNGKLTPVIGREREIKAIARTMTRSKKNNPLLLGDAGVGKTAVVEGLAFAIVEENAPHTLLGKRIVQIEIGTLVAGTSLRGQFEERLVGLLDEVKSSGNVILFIDEIHTIVGAGDTIDSNLDAANILKPVLSRGEIMCIGATTHEEYRRAIAQDAALERRFRIVEIGEPSPDETLAILENLKGHYERHHKVLIGPEALAAAVRLSTQYLLNRHQPDKALDLLDEACARLVVHGPHGGGAVTNVVTNETLAEAAPLVTADLVTDVLAEWTGIPVAQLSADERHKYQVMETALKQRVIGQDHAVSAVADALRANRAGLSDPRRPVGAFLFLGPSGVGKTELARALAAYLFGTEDALLRFDMSEFHDEHTAARLIGSPPGYKDSQRGGQLTEALRRRPYAVILLDEVEKAAPSIFDLFLQVFDEGRLTDARGGTADARHAVWIMTSNIGTGDASRGGLGFGQDSAGASALAQAEARFQAALKKFFRPEFLNRLDDVIVFHPLTPAVTGDILSLQLENLRARLEHQNLRLELTPAARDLILAEGCDSVHGARLLRRTLDRLLIRPLGRYLLDAAFDGPTRIRADAVDGGLIFSYESR